jgi:hypothetical protein
MVSAPDGNVFGNPNTASRGDRKPERSLGVAP